MIQLQRMINHLKEYCNILCKINLAIVFIGQSIHIGPYISFSSMMIIAPIARKKYPCKDNKGTKKNSKDGYTTPNSSPLNSGDDQFTDSTNTLHANSSSIES